MLSTAFDYSAPSQLVPAPPSPGSRILLSGLNVAAYGDTDITFRDGSATGTAAVQVRGKDGVGLTLPVNRDGYGEISTDSPLWFANTLGIRCVGTVWYTYAGDGAWNPSRLRNLVTDLRKGANFFTTAAGTTQATAAADRIGRWQRYGGTTNGTSQNDTTNRLYLQPGVGVYGDGTAVTFGVAGTIVGPFTMLARVRQLVSDTGNGGWFSPGWSINARMFGPGGNNWTYFDDLTGANLNFTKPAVNSWNLIGLRRDASNNVSVTVDGLEWVSAGSTATNAVPQISPAGGALVANQQLSDLVVVTGVMADTDVRLVRAFWGL